MSAETPTTTKMLSADRQRQRIAFESDLVHLFYQDPLLWKFDDSSKYSISRRRNVLWENIYNLLKNSYPIEIKKYTTPMKLRGRVLAMIQKVKYVLKIEGFDGPDLQYLDVPELIILHKMKEENDNQQSQKETEEATDVTKPFDEVKDNLKWNQDSQGRNISIQCKACKIVIFPDKTFSNIKEHPIICSKAIYEDEGNQGLLVPSKMYNKIIPSPTVKLDLAVIKANMQWNNYESTIIPPPQPPPTTIGRDGIGIRAQPRVLQLATTTTKMANPSLTLIKNFQPRVILFPRIKVLRPVLTPKIILPSLPIKLENIKSEIDETFSDISEYQTNTSKNQMLEHQKLEKQLRSKKLIYSGVSNNEDIIKCVINYYDGEKLAYKCSKCNIFMPLNVELKLDEHRNLCLKIKKEINDSREASPSSPSTSPTIRKRKHSSSSPEAADADLINKRITSTEVQKQRQHEEETL